MNESDAIMKDLYGDAELIEALQGDEKVAEDVMFEGNFTNILPSTETNNWFGTQADEYRPDKEQYFLNKFTLDYPELAVNIDGFEMLSKLASRSNILRDWWVNTDSDYVLSVKVPVYFKNLIEPKEFSKLQSIIGNISSLQKKKVDEQKVCVEKFKKEYQSIECKQEYQKIDALRNSNPKLIILTMTSNQLPLSISMRIEKYTPIDDTMPTKSAYAREALITYKMSLLKLIKDKNLNNEQILEVIKNNAPK